jgi:hypothetical protein
MKPDTALVITSVSAPTEPVKEYAAGCRSNGMDFIVVGDRKTPADFALDGCRYLSLAEQGLLSFQLAHLLPENHYSRKNIGYLLCKDKDVIVETDDDNSPLDTFWLPREEMQTAPVFREEGWINVYRYFSDVNIWPRGFPLEYVRMPAGSGPALLPAEAHFAPIQQGLSDGDPDVDAVYRMTQPLPVHFDPGLRLALAGGARCPFNSQNTTWFKPAFILMYLPSTCSMRLTDIWRSFVAQRIAATCGWPILFHSPTVVQERNAHNLADDFALEMPGYLANDSIWRQLSALELAAGEAHLAENLLRCYRMLVQQSYLSPAELPMVEAWIEEFQ